MEIIDSFQMTRSIKWHFRDQRIKHSVQPVRGIIYIIRRERLKERVLEKEMSTFVIPFVAGIINYICFNLWNTE